MAKGDPVLNIGGIDLFSEQVKNIPKPTQAQISGSYLNFRRLGLPETAKVKIGNMISDLAISIETYLEESGLDKLFGAISGVDEQGNKVEVLPEMPKDYISIVSMVLEAKIKGYFFDRADIYAEAVRICIGRDFPTLKVKNAGKAKVTKAEKASVSIDMSFDLNKG